MATQGSDLSCIRLQYYNAYNVKIKYHKTKVAKRNCETIFECYFLFQTLQTLCFLFYHQILYISLPKNIFYKKIFHLALSIKLFLAFVLRFFNSGHQTPSLECFGNTQTQIENMHIFKLFRRSTSSYQPNQKRRLCMDLKMCAKVYLTYPELF